MGQFYTLETLLGTGQSYTLNRLLGCGIDQLHTQDPLLETGQLLMLDPLPGMVDRSVAHVGPSARSGLWRRSCTIWPTFNVALKSSR